MRYHSPRRAAPRLALAAILCTQILTFDAAAQVADDVRPVIRSQAELPRHTYPLGVSSASELLTNDEAFFTLVASVEASIQSDLTRYVIEDQATLRSYYGTLASIALLRGDHDAVLDYTSLLAEAQDKPAERLIAGLVTRAVVAAERAGDDAAVRHEVFRRTYRAKVEGLPWIVVQDAVKETKAQSEILSRNLILGLIQSQYDPAVAASGSASGDLAAALINLRTLLDRRLEYMPLMGEVLGEYISANDVEKEDIWAARDVDLLDASELHPVVIGIWDTGVDPEVFGKQVLRDENGDPVYGAFAAWSREPASGPLLALAEDEAALYPTVRDQMKGLQDMQANVDSPEAVALRAYLASLTPEEVRPFIEQLSLFGSYSHGTHVAGIAVKGNPAARLVSIRETFPSTMIPPPLTREVAYRWAANMQIAVDGLKQHGARVVNMSWGGGPRDAERSYELNGIGETSEERQRMAMEAYEIMAAAMKHAMASAPDVLFIPAAGNSDDDVEFSQMIPAGIVLPNVLTVGAVDQAGEETSFTSFGSTVRVHANGYQVESYIPGGELMKMSGTSMSAPNATNLAAKLLAINPSLSPEEVIELIIEGADRSEDGRRILMNPRRSLELLSGGR